MVSLVVDLLFVFIDKANIHTFSVLQNYRLPNYNNLMTNCIYLFISSKNCNISITLMTYRITKSTNKKYWTKNLNIAL